MPAQSEQDLNSLAEPALRTFGQIAKAWSLTELEQSAILALPARTEELELKSHRFIDARTETLERISYVLGIYQALHTIFSNQQQANGWIRRPNSAALFKGRTALSLMCSGTVGDLAAVRRHLDEQIGHF